MPDPEFDALQVGVHLAVDGGRVMLVLRSADGTQTAYMSPDQALDLASALIQLAREALKQTPTVPS